MADDFNMTDNSSMNESTPFNATEGQPRLRKIKRPKMHNGPIENVPQAASASSIQNTAANTGGLIRASQIQQLNNQGQNLPNAAYANPVAEPADDYEEDSYVPANAIESFMDKLDYKKFLGLLLGCFVIGVVFGKIFFSSEQVVLNGLQDVVTNPEVPHGRARCGVVEKTQGCVLYVMNPQRQDLNGRDFYDLASQLTGRQRFVIETGNMRYSSVKIKPGNIAQLNIPPLQ